MVFFFLRKELNVSLRKPNESVILKFHFWHLSTRVECPSELIIRIIAAVYLSF